MSSIWSRSDRQELEDSGKFSQLSENEKRLAIRNELAAHNKHLAAAAKDAGVKTPLDYAIFQDHGDRGLYGGLAASERRKRQANQAHFAVGKKVRQTIEDLGGTMPEALPTPKQGIMQIQGARKIYGKMACSTSGVASARGMTGLLLTPCRGASPTFAVWQYSQLLRSWPPS